MSRYPPEPPDPVDVDPRDASRSFSIDLEDLLESEDLKGLAGIRQNASSGAFASSPTFPPSSTSTSSTLLAIPRRRVLRSFAARENGDNSMDALNADLALLGSEDANGQHGDDTDDALGPSDRPYSPYPTIDWLRDAKLDRARKRRQLLARLSDTSPPTLGKRVWALLEAGRGWLSVLVAGIVTGIVAAFIAIATAFLVDLKSGVCTAPVSATGDIGWYLGKRACCLGTKGDPEAGECPEWRDWSDLLYGVPGGVSVNYAAFVVLSVLMGLASCYLVVYLAPWAAGEGIPELKTLLGGNRIPGFLSPQTFLVKAAGLPLAIGSGLSIGKEGALLHVAACLGRFAGDATGVVGEGGRREMLSSAAAAGIAVAFGAPIGGVLYSLEEVSTFFPLRTIWRSFLCAMVAAATVHMIDPYRGKSVVFEVPMGDGWKMFEVWNFALLGAVGAVFGAFFITVNLKIQAWRDSYNPPPGTPKPTAAPPASNDIPLPELGVPHQPTPARPQAKAIRDDRPLLARPLVSALALSLLTALFFYPSPITRLDDLRVLELLFRDCPSPLPKDDPLCPAGPVARTKLAVQLLASMALKALFTTATYSLPIPSSVFIPSMVVGATFGRFFGMLMQVMAPRWVDVCGERPDEDCVGVGRYALLGAVGALGGVTRLTASLTVIMFEVTGQLDLVVPSMVTLATARLVSNLFVDRGFADAVIRLKGYPYLPAEREGGIGADVGDCMTPASDLVSIDEQGISWANLRSIMKLGFAGFPVVRDGDLLAGFVSIMDIERVVVGISGVDDGTVIEFGERTEGQRIGIGGGLNVIVVEGRPGATGRATPTPVSSSPAPGSPGRLSVLNLRPLVDTSPLTLNPHVPADMAADLFRKIGPRCILVTRRGKLEGLLTKKDLLRAIEEIEVLGDAAYTDPDEDDALNAELQQDEQDDDDLFIAATVDDAIPFLERTARTARTWAQEFGEFVRREMEDDVVPLVMPTRNRRRG